MILKNSQCGEGYECVDNFCIEKSKIDLCQKVSLSTGAQPLEAGKPINSAKRFLTKSDLPYLLSDGEIIEVKEGNLTEYFYSPSLLIGGGEIDIESNSHIIKNINKFSPLYTLRFDFSNAVDFSNKNFHGQVLRILGSEYVIGSKSTIDEIELISENKKINLKEKDNIKLIKDSEGNVLSIEIKFYPLNGKDKLNLGEKHVDNTFNSVKFDFSGVDNNEIATLNIGGNCL